MRLQTGSTHSRSLLLWLMKSCTRHLGLDTKRQGWNPECNCTAWVDERSAEPTTGIGPGPISLLVERVGHR